MSVPPSTGDLRAVGPLPLGHIHHGDSRLRVSTIRLLTGRTGNHLRRSAVCASLTMKVRLARTLPSLAAQEQQSHGPQTIRQTDVTLITRRQVLRAFRRA